MPSRSDWIQAGLAAVADHGPNGLRIDRLCRSLGVSKGSFHHHFAGSGDFKQTILAAYETLVVEALDRAIDSGFILPADRSEILGLAGATYES